MQKGQDAVRRRTRIISWLAVVAAATAGALVMGLLPPAEPLEALVVDAWFRLRGPERPAEAVVVVAVDGPSLRRLGAWPWPPETHERLLRALCDASPAALATLLPSTEELRARFPEVVFAPALEHDPYRPGEVALAPWEREALLRAAPGQVGIAFVETESGVARRKRLLYDLPEGPVPSLELAVALRLAGVGMQAVRRAPDALSIGARTVPLEEGELRIRHAGPARSYPYISAYRVLDGEVLPETFRGRAVLLGPTEPAVAPGFATPPGGRLPTPPVEVHASALGTVLTGRYVRRLSAPALAALLLFLGFALALLQRRLPPLPAFALFASASLVAAPAAAFAAFALASTVVPVVPLAALLLFLVLGLASASARDIDRGMGDLVEEFTRLDRRFYAEREEGDVRHWDRALDMASLYLDAESFLLFKKPPGVWHLQLAAALRTTEAELKERRRDIRRTPWSEAIDLGQPIVRDRLMEPSRSSLICPLTSARALVGMLVVNQPRGGEGFFLAKKAMIRFIAEQLATLLNRELLKERLRRRAEGPLGFLEHDRVRDRLDALTAVVHASVEKKELLYSVLNAIEAGVVICDMFGRVVLYNAQVAEVGAALGTKVEGQNVLDLLREIAGLDRPAAIHKMGELVAENRPVHLDVRSGGKHVHHYRLELSAVRRRAPAGEPQDEQPVLGVVCIFTDVTELKEVDIMKTNLLNMISYRVLNLLTSIQGYSEILLESSSLQGDEREYMGTIARLSHSLGALFEDFGGALQFGFDRMGLRRIPLDLVAIIDGILERRAQEVEEKGIRLDRPAAERYNVVMADRDLIEKALDQTLGVAVSNCLRGSRLRVAIEEEEQFLRIDVENTGSGVPNERLQTLFQKSPHAAAAAGDEGADLHYVKEVFELHGGNVEADGALGEGLRVSLRLPLFMKAEADGASR